MNKIYIKTTDQVIPMIYCYTTPEIARHSGWVKIGYTEKQTTENRQKQQSHTVDVIVKEEWKGNAIFEDGSGEIFHDTDFHSYLSKKGIERTKGTEWFHIEPQPAKNKFINFRENRGILKELGGVTSYTLREEQQKAVTVTKKYAENHKNGEFLWNAKPRFGKTLSAYDYCKTTNAQKVLIVTNRPAIANSWYSDYEQFLGTESGYSFVSDTDTLKGNPLCISYEKYVEGIKSGIIKQDKLIEFVSLQDLKGSIYFGGEYDKLQELNEMQWDILIIDEAHEGVDTYKTDVAFDHINRSFTLHLSGTPFKALANDKFEQDAIFNWTYVDEQKKKRDWKGENRNPYLDLPSLNMFTYQMSEIVKDEIEKGIEIKDDTVEYAFDLNEFFRTKNGSFVHDASVDKFLDALTTQEKFPFSTEQLRNELKHTFWLLKFVDSAKELEKKLREHPVFKEYKIVLAAGDGKSLDEGEEVSAELNQKSFDKVKKAIEQNEKTITLSVGQLTTGITIPEWTAVLMLGNMKSPAVYMQSAFRSQNPCLFQNGGKYERKQNAYVFDFDPARTLTIFEEFANDLSPDTSDGRGDSEKRKENVRELLNFFPVIGEDENGEMVELDAENVLSIPRKIHAQEVVKRGFMSDFLFQNISNVFHAPKEVLAIINKFTAVLEPKTNANITPQTAEELSINNNGEVELSDNWVIGKSKEIFGDKIYTDDIQQKLAEKVLYVADPSLEALKDTFKQSAVAPIFEVVQKNYIKPLQSSEKKRLESKIQAKTDEIVGKAYGDFSIKQKVIEKEHSETLTNCTTESEKKAAVKIFEAKMNTISNNFLQTLTESVDTIKKETCKEIVIAVEKQSRQKEKEELEKSVKDHLRGFSRTIPSFLMAYGESSVTLENFDTIIPDDVFEEVTSITLENFRFLRDGGEYTNTETGEKEHFAGNLFDNVVFNDSVTEFMNKKISLANYFEEAQKEDIFDYIPPQKTNQIFTPKWIVKKMVDMLEQENPGCFDDSEKTFADLYMKSGLYIAEIVKRLYNSKGLKKKFPDSTERLQHIFKRQVYGLAPTPIIYKIATNYILGFNKNMKIKEHNFRLVDSLELAKTGKLQQKITELY